MHFKTVSSKRLHPKRTTTQKGILLMRFKIVHLLAVILSVAIGAAVWPKIIDLGFPMDKNQPSEIMISRERGLQIVGGVIGLATGVVPVVVTWFLRKQRHQIRDPTCSVENLSDYEQD